MKIHAGALGPAAKLSKEAGPKSTVRCVAWGPSRFLLCAKGKVCGPSSNFAADVQYWSEGRRVASLQSESFVENHLPTYQIAGIWDFWGWQWRRQAQVGPGFGATRSAPPRRPKRRPRPSRVDSRAHLIGGRLRLTAKPRSLRGRANRTADHGERAATDLIRHSTRGNLNKVKAAPLICTGAMGLFSAIKRSLGSPGENQVDASESASQQLEKHVFPEQLRKDLSPDHIEEPSEKEEEPVAATPSVVIPWVLREVVENTEKDRFALNFHAKLHAKRLSDCWLEYGDQFPKDFAQTLVEFLSDLCGDRHPYARESRLACFLVGGYSPLHNMNNGQELWPSVVEEICRIHLARGEEWNSTASSQSKEQTKKLLFSMAERHTDRTCDVCGFYDGRIRRVPKSEMIIALEALRKEIQAADVPAAREERVKAQVKRAPWEAKGKC